MCNLNKIIGLTILTCFFSIAVKAQELPNSAEVDSIQQVRILTEEDIVKDTLSKLMHQAEASLSITEKEKLSGIFQNILIEQLKKENSFALSLDTIPYIAQLLSADSLVRIFSWSIPTSKAGVFNYNCILQHRLNKATKISDVFILEDTKNRILLPEQEILKYPNWYGCLYYQIVEKKDGKKTYYTLIGHDFNDGVTYKKCIDVLTFDKYANPVFGAPVFMLGKKPQNRVLFEYSAQSVMKLAYFVDIDTIVFNYLFPIAEEKENDRRYYVPDITYEGLMFRLGKWIKIPNVEMKLKE